MKNINDICILVQARLGSQRVPGKMLRPFVNTTLIDILFEKLKSSTIIPQKNIYFSAYEKELKDIANKHSINIFHRSKQSAFSEGESLPEIFEWHDKLPFKYVVLVSACNPLLKIKTIDKFIEEFTQTEEEGGFAVFEKKTYYWDKTKTNITDWKGLPIMNTKLVDPVYEAAHCLYASRMDIIQNEMWLSDSGPDNIKLFAMDELEAFDIDYEWQFKVAEQLYKNRENLWTE